MKKNNSEYSKEYFFELSQDLICIIDFDACFKFVNPAWEKILGYSAKELLSKPFLEFVHPDDRNQSNKEIEDLFRGSLTKNFENRYICKDSSICYIQWSAASWKDEKAIYCIGKDVSESIEAEKLLSANEEKYEALTHNSITAIYIIQDAKMVYVNPQFCKLFGYTEDDIIDKLSPAELIHPDDVPRLQINLRNRFAGKLAIGNIEYRAIKKDGSVFFIEVYSTIVLFKGNSSVQGTIIDITERKKIENELRESEVFFEQQFQQSATSKQIFDPEGWALRVNPKFCELFGVKSEDTVNKYNLFHDKEAAAKGVQEKFKWVLEHKKPIDLEVHFDIKHAADSTGLETSKHEKIWLQFVLYPIINKDGKLIYVVFEHKDITEQKQAAEELRKSEEKYKYLFESMAQGVFYQSADGSLIDVNQSALDMFGLTRNQFLGRDSYDPGWKVINEDGSDLIPDKHPSIIALKTGKEVRNAVLGVFSPKTSEYKWLSVYAKPLFKEDEKKPYQVFVTLHDITERKQSETALKESSKLLLNLTAQVPGAIYQFLLKPDGTTCFPYSSMGIKDIYGVTPEQIKTSAELVFAALHPDDLKSISEKIQKSADNMSPWRDEYRVILPNEKESSWREGYAIPEKLEDGSTLWHGFITNIDQRKKAEERIYEMNSRLSSIIESPGNMIIFSLDKNYCYTAFNKKHYAEMKNVYNAEIEVGKNMIDYISIEHVKPIAKKSFIRVLNGESFTEVQQQPDMEVYYEFSWNPIFNSNNEVFGLSCFIQDITERKQAEVTLRESEERFSKSFYELPTPMAILDLITGERVTANESFAKLIGYSLSEVLVGNMYKENFAYDQNKLKEIVNLIKKKGFVSNEYFQMVSKSGKIISVLASAAKLHISDGNTIVVSYEDITEKEKNENLLKKTHRELQELKNQIEKENVYLKEEIGLEHNFNEIIGNSKVLKSMLKQIEQVSITDTTVLVLGETGTGKELVARAIHGLSERRDKPLVKVNCSAIPSELIESELFGHEKGAFTGAIERKIGRFELAHQGTIFLDEIGDLSLNLQSRLLRVLQESEFERVGSSITQKVNVRVIAATNRNLEKLVLEGEFRQDLYYRLNVFPLICPALKDRLEDIPLLVTHFIKKFSPKIKNKIKTVNQSLINTLKSYYWPGNIRELEHVIERAMVVSQGERLQIGNWFLKDSPMASVEREITTLEENEREYIHSVLEQCNWKIRGVNGAAEILGLKPTTLESRMKKLGIKR